MNQIQEISKVALLYKKAVRRSVGELATIIFQETDGDTAFAFMFITQDLHHTRLYKQWKQHREGILRDCVTEYQLERWMAESLFGIDLDELIMSCFKSRWGRILKQHGK